MRKLRDYQKHTVREIRRFKGRALLALEMGLGKTIVALHWHTRYNGGKTVVVCPASVKWQWQDEAWEHYGLSSLVCEGRTPESEDDPNDFDLLIINYDILAYWVDWIKNNYQRRTVILDEVHYCKNLTARRTQASRRLCKGAKYVLALSGTPMTSKPSDLWPTLNMLKPSVYQAFLPFENEFCIKRRTRWGWQYRGAKNLDRLHSQLTRRCMIRLRKDDVLKELPHKSREIVPVEIVRRLDYAKAERDIVKWLRQLSLSKSQKAKGAEGITKLTVLRQLAAELKLPAVFDWIDEYLIECDRKLVIFGWHKKIIHAIAERYNCIVIDGSTPPAERPKLVNQFQQSKKKRVFIGNIKAAGNGIDGLQKVSSDVSFIEFPWTPADLIQAEDRVHRFGQKNKVSIRMIVAKDTVEHKFARILQSKQTTLDAAMDGKQVSGLDLFDQLISQLRNGR